MSQLRRFVSSVLFDLDGTLVDSAPAILATLELVLKRHGIEPAVAPDRGLIGAPLMAMLARVTGAAREADLAPIAETFRGVYDDEGLFATAAYDGLSDVLGSLTRSGYQLYIVTNKRDLPTRRILQLFGVDRFFTGVHALDTSVPPARDKRDLVARVISVYGLRAADCVMIGDTVEDAVAAQANGVSFIAATYGYGTPTVAAPVAALATIGSLRQLPANLAEVAANPQPSSEA